MHALLQVAVNGLIAGSLIALLAVSYSLIYSILRFINFAFGEILMLSAYLFFLLRSELEFPILLAAILAAFCLGLLGTALQVGAYRPFYRRSRLASLVTALGLSIIFQNLALITFEGRPLSLPAKADSVIQLGAVVFTLPQVWIFFASLFLLVVTDLLVFRSSAGLRLRALADNLPMAELMGVHVDRSIAVVFFLGSLLAGTSGTFMALEHLLKPTMGMAPGIQAFAACVVGGIGSIRGAVVAAFFIAIVSHFVSFAIPSVTPETTSYAVLLIALTTIPAGFSALPFSRILWVKQATQMAAGDLPNEDTLERTK